MSGAQTTWVVVVLEGKIEVWREHKNETDAYRDARSLGSKVIKVVRREVLPSWTHGPP